MTNEELLFEFARELRNGGLHEVASNRAVELRAELLRRLGAAVSASPQREIQAAKNVLLERFAKTFDQVYFHEMAAEIRAEIVPLDSSIFAAAPAQEPAKCEGCKLQSLDAFEHDDCFIDKVVDQEQARWQKALYDLSRKHAIAPDEIDGSGCDSGDPLDLTLAEVGQVICQLENPEDYKPAAQEQPVENSPQTYQKAIQELQIVKFVSDGDGDWIAVRKHGFDKLRALAEGKP